MTEPRLVVSVGDLMTDVVALARETAAAGSDTRSNVRVGGGGAAANTAAWLAFTGHPVAFVGRAGDDVLGRAALAELREAGVLVRAAVDPVLSTGVCVVVVGLDGQRSMYPNAGANAALSPVDLPADLLGPGGAKVHLHLSGYSLLSAGSRPAALAAVAVARAAGHSVSIDPASAGPIGSCGPATVLGWLDGAQLLLANEDEARLLAGEPDPMTAGAILAERFGETVVKLGARGAAWFGSAGACAQVPATPARVLDTTGAGDCFAAGFVPAWLAGAEPAAALEAGCALAARVVAVAGARPPG